MTDVEFVSQYHYRHIVDSYGFPISRRTLRPENKLTDELFAIPKGLSLGTVTLPTFVEHEDLSYEVIYTETDVVQFYVYHHPEGYTEDDKNNGIGTKENPFLDFETACEKIDCYLNRACECKVQIIIDPKSEPLSKGYDFKHAPRVIVGSTDGTTFFKIKGDLFLDVAWICQATSEDQQAAALYASRFDPLERYTYSKRSASDESRIYSTDRTDYIQLSENSWYLAFGPLPNQKEVIIETGIIRTQLTSPTYAKEFTTALLCAFDDRYLRPDDWGHAQTSALVTVHDDGSIELEWQNGEKATFSPSGEQEWKTDKELHLPDLRTYYNCKIVLDRISVYHVYGDYHEAYPYKDQDVIRFVKKGDNGEARGSIYEYKDGKKGAYITTIDLYLPPPKSIRPVVYKCNNIYISHDRASYRTGGAIAVDCSFTSLDVVGRSYDIELYAAVNCKVRNSKIYASICHKCDMYDSYVECDVFSFSFATYSEDYDSNSVFRIYTCISSNIKAQSLGNHIEVCQSTQIECTAQDPFYKLSFDKLIDSAIGITYNQKIKSSRYFLFVSDILSNTSVHIYANITVGDDSNLPMYLSVHAVEINNNTLYSNADIHTEHIQVDFNISEGMLEDRCYGVEICDIYEQYKKCVAGYREITRGTGCDE